MFDQFLTVFQLYRSGQCTYLGFPGVPLTSTPHNNISKPLAAFPLNPFLKRPWFLSVCSTSLLKTMREKKKFLVTCNFSFSHSVFYPFAELSAIFIKVEIVVCKLFQFGRD